jgi:hypothetical protein
MRDIVVSHLPGGQWVAWHDTDKNNNHSGYGATPEEALADLERLDQERAEALEDAEHIDSDYDEQAGGY